MDGRDADRLDRLEARLDALAEENARLRHRLAEAERPAAASPTPVRSARASAARPDRAAPGDAAAGAAAEPVPRRQALRAGLAAVAGVAGAVVLDAAPAAAADGDPLELGLMANRATDHTGLYVEGPVPYGLGVTDTGALHGLPDQQPAALYAQVNEGGHFTVGLGVTGTGVQRRGIEVHTEGHGVVSSSDRIALGGESTGMYGLAASGGTAAIWLPGDGERSAPTLDGTTYLHLEGELVIDGDGDLWWCIEGGRPGRWRKVVGRRAAGALHVLDVPARAHDSRTGGGAPLAAGGSRRIDLRAGTGVEDGATAVLVNLLVVDAAPGNAHATAWADGAPRPQANSMVWGGSSGRASSLVLTRVDATGACRVSTSVRAHVVVDVVGYHR